MGRTSHFSSIHVNTYHDGQERLICINHNPREKTFQALEHYRQQEEILRASIALDYSDADPLRMVNNMTLQQAADKLSEVMVERMQLEDELNRESETVVSAMKAMTYDGVGQHKGRDSTALLNKVAVLLTCNCLTRL